ncbi:MAG: hypothetical protein IJD04_04530 [Desulfovibrionaceae bacterium]|nr:hypothetical protein [Desulfovibrionaceae bacterium]
MKKIITTIAGFMLTGGPCVAFACDDEASQNMLRMAYEVIEEKNAKVLRILRDLDLQTVEEAEARDTYNLLKSLEKLIQQNDDVLTGVTMDLNNRLAGLCD